MTREVSRLYTDYFPTPQSDEPPNEKTSASPSPFAATTRRARSKRIFVARIPSSVSEDEMRKHFESFGAVEDAYRPRDFTKNTFRGIGFVTFVDPDAVDRVIAMKHTLGGAEVVVDRATPKEANSTRLEPNAETGHPQQPSETMTEAFPAFPTVESAVNNDSWGASVGVLNERAFDMDLFNSVTAHYPSSAGNSRGPPSNFSADFSGEVAPQLPTGAEFMDSHPTVLHGMKPVAMGMKSNPSNSDAPLKRTKSGSASPAAKHEKTLKVTDNLAHVRKVRGGPRIFVGKISKDTIEQDLADYFSQFGFVMDVYIPRSRENKKEHRGFGFVTFETEASIKRAISQGTHILKGAALAIDVAVPENTPSN